MNVNHLVHGLNVAFDITELRTHHIDCPTLFQTGKKPSQNLLALRAEMHEIVTHMENEVGQQKRLNAQRVKEYVKKAWEKDGESMEEFEFFLDWCELRGRPKREQLANSAATRAAQRRRTRNAPQIEEMQDPPQPVRPPLGTPPGLLPRSLLRPEQLLQNMMMALGPALPDEFFN